MATSYIKINEVVRFHSIRLTFCVKLVHIVRTGHVGALVDERLRPAYDGVEEDGTFESFCVSKWI